MEQHKVKIQSIGKVTHDVLQIVMEKPENYSFTPGQATELSIDKEGWRDERRPFTFTCLPDDNYLEFTIKTYPSRKGVTDQLLTLKKNDIVIVRDVFGAITYKGEGVFIAGGAGVTPFISIFRYLQSKKLVGNNKLIFANKMKADIIHEAEFSKILGNNFINILSEEKIAGYANGHINAEFIKTHIGDLQKTFYVCGPPPMMDAVDQALASLGVSKNAITVEL